MDVLPLKSIREEDGLVVGKNLLNLAKLSQSNFAVAEGIIVLPPELKFKTVLKKFKFKEKEVFEQSLEIVRSEILKISPYEELEKETKGKSIDLKKLWQNLLEGWIGEVRSKIFREGITPDLAFNLSAQPVFFTKKITVSGEAYFDYDLKHSSINLNFGNLDYEQTLELDLLTKAVDKKLFLPQIINFIYDGKLKIIKLLPFTQHLKKDLKTLDRSPMQLSIIKDNPIPKTIVKVFLDLSETMQVSPLIDGAIILSEKIADIELKKGKLAEVAKDLVDKPVIFKLLDQKNGFNDIRGTLKLIHKIEVLKVEAEVFLFSRNKKLLLNTQIAIPYVRSCEEFSQIKRELSTFKINRKGSLKFWMEVAVLENILNIEDYLEVGLDGVIINLDELAAKISGFEKNSEEELFYKAQVSGLLKFLEEGIRTLKKANVPIIFKGELVLNHEVLEFIVEKGIFAVVVDPNLAISTKEQILFLERHHLKHHSLN